MDTRFGDAVCWTQGPAPSASPLSQCVCVCFWKGAVWRSIIHYQLQLLGITVNKVRNQERKGENRDLASYPAAFCFAVQLATQSFGWRKSLVRSNPLGGVVSKETVIENLIKMLNKCVVCLQSEKPPVLGHLNVLRLIRSVCTDHRSFMNSHICGVVLMLHREF